MLAERLRGRGSFWVPRDRWRAVAGYHVRLRRGQLVERAANRAAPRFQDVRADHGGFHAGVAQKRRAYVIAVLKQVSREWAAFWTAS